MSVQSSTQARDTSSYDFEEGERVLRPGVQEAPPTTYRELEQDRDAGVTVEEVVKILESVSEDGFNPSDSPVDRNDYLGWKRYLICATGNLGRDARAGVDRLVNAGRYDELLEDYNLDAPVAPVHEDDLSGSLGGLERSPRPTASPTVGAD